MTVSIKSLLCLLLAGWSLAVTDPLTSARAADSSPYLIGDWKLNDVFADFTAKGFKPLATQNSAFVFLNPTSLTLTLEYAFFAVDDHTKNVIFCGCDRDTLKANGRVRYTMQAEVEGGQFSRSLCPTQTEGPMKTLVYTGSASGPITFNDATQAGYQIDVFSRVSTKHDHDTDDQGHEAEMSTSPLLAINLNDHTKAEAQAVHALCNGFIH